MKNSDKVLENGFEDTKLKFMHEINNEDREELEAQWSKRLCECVL